MHSRDGKYVYVADAGDIIDTSTHTITAHMDYLANCRHGFVEMDWKNGQSSPRRPTSASGIDSSSGP